MLRLIAQEQTELFGVKMMGTGVEKIRSCKYHSLINRSPVIHCQQAAVHVNEEVMLQRSLVAVKPTRSSVFFGEALPLSVAP
jgi:hypothetical protein